VVPDIHALQDADLISISRSKKVSMALNDGSDGRINNMSLIGSVYELLARISRHIPK
jgi:hypothetical protein